MTGLFTRGLGTFSFGFRRRTLRFIGIVVSIALILGKVVSLLGAFFGSGRVVVRCSSGLSL
jgi:hypothetical protein